MKDKVADGWINGAATITNILLLWHIIKNIWLHDVDAIIVFVAIFVFFILPVWIISLTVIRS